MTKQQLKLGASLFVLGLIGVLSILTAEITLPEKMMVLLKEKVAEEYIPWLLLINPTIMLVGLTVVGTVFYKKVNLGAPILENLLGENHEYDLGDIMKFGIGGGILAGVLLGVVSLISYPMLPQEFLEAGEKMKPGLLARFLYGGIAEEIMMRFGMMSLAVWVVFKISGKLNDGAYWIGIAVAALFFAAGHLPLLNILVENPTPVLYVYIIVANAVGGVIFGWLYWKKGLEAAFLGHIFAHVVMVLSEQFLT